MFDPETLRTFIAVAETGSFSKAAEDIVTLFTQRRPEISGFLEIFGNPRS
ncbi:hypothetical protein RTH84_001751 [Escherichia coli]|nr:hypothetical protein [Escherichia coli]